MVLCVLCTTPYRGWEWKISIKNLKKVNRACKNLEWNGRRFRLLHFIELIKHQANQFSIFSFSILHELLGSAYRCNILLFTFSFFLFLSCSFSSRILVPVETFNWFYENRISFRLLFWQTSINSVIRMSSMTMQMPYTPTYIHIHTLMKKKKTIQKRTSYIEQSKIV